MGGEERCVGRKREKGKRKKEGRKRKGRRRKQVIVTDFRLKVGRVF